MQKAFVVVLTVYAVLAIAPDTLRPFPTFFLTQKVQTLCKKLSGNDCYPLGTLGFETDNNGKVEKVELSGLAAGIKEGDQIVLESVKPDRRIINKLYFVANGNCYSFYVARSSHGPFTMMAEDETFKGYEVPALEIAEASGLFFILLCWFLVWHHPMPPTWGLFFYSLWFNSGQYFFWYANLPEHALIAFNFIQVVLQALGLAGFLAFALYFPYKNLKGWRSAARPNLLYLLGIVFGLLCVFNGLGFMNLVRPWHTETPFQVYYALTLGVFFLAALLLGNTYLTQPQARPKVLWIAVFGCIGLLFWLLADIYETTGMLDGIANWLSHSTPPWLDEYGWTTQAILNLMYAMNLTLPLAFLYTTLHHRVMGLRFLVSNTLVVLVPFLLFLALIEFFVDWLNWPGKLILAAFITGFFHDRLYRLFEGLLFPQWHHEKEHLEVLVKKLLYVEDLDLSKVNDILVQAIGHALGLKWAALFHRRDDDGSFMREDVFQWPDDLEQKLPADYAFSARDGSTIRLDSLGSNPVRLRVPDDEDGRDSSRDSLAAILAVPVIIRHHVRNKRDSVCVSRLLLFVRDEDFDPDEVDVIREVSLAAAVAYRCLDLEARQRPDHMAHSHRKE